MAATVEPAFRDAGVPVFSNARNFRMTPDGPLVVPQVNGDHLAMVPGQASFSTTGGYIVTNANCSTTGMVIALAPLQSAFGIEAVRLEVAVLPSDLAALMLASADGGFIGVVGNS